MPSAVGKGKSRSARLSSPRVRNGAPARRGSPGEWIEPTLKDAKASYEDHGGMPFGVLEDMQPLGQRPNAKARSRVKAEPLRKSLGKSVGALLDYNMTPEGTPPVDTPRSTSEIPQEEAALVPIPTMEHAVDDDYTPQVAKRTTRVSRRTRGSSGISDPVKTTSPSLPPLVDTVTRDSSPPAHDDSTLAPDMPDHEIEKVNFDAVVDAAVSRAKNLGSEAFGAAFQLSYLELRDNEHYTHLLRAILSKTATEEDESDFRVAISKAKRTLRRTQTTPAPSQVESSVKNSTPNTRSRQAQAARPLMENGTTKPSIKLNFGRRAAEARVNGAINQSRRQTRSRDKSASAPLTPLPDDVDMADDVREVESVQSVPAEAPLEKHDARESDQSPMSSESVQGPLHLEPVGNDDLHAQPSTTVHEDAQSNEDGLSTVDSHRALKRSPLEAGFDPPATDMIEHAKRRRLDETIRKDPPEETIEESHIRETMDTSRSLRKRAPVQYKPTIKLTNTTPNTRHKRPPGREPSDSPLSDMSMTPPPVIEPPTDKAADRPRKKAKTKQSPVKKQLPLGDERGLRGASQGPQEDEDESDNSDYCNACRGSGFLLCCDGCDRAFHFSCVDPPLDANSSALDEAYYCQTCVAKKNPPARQPRGLFAGLLHSLERRTPSIYALPRPIQNYFTGVNAGKDGHFEDSSAQKARNTRAGYDEPFETLKTKDNRGNNILCYHCGRSSAGKREIITCDICGNHWHLDCTHPPLANPPYRDQFNRKARDWMCPLHVEHDLSAIDPMRLVRRRKLHIRRPKNARVVDSHLRRGFVNNGQIEIVDDTSSEEDTEFETDPTPSGTVTRVPARGIKLDFIDKVHTHRHVEEETEAHLPPAMRTRINSRVLVAELASRDVATRKAALELVQFASRQDEISLASGRIENLIFSLTAEAPPSVVERIAADEKGGEDDDDDDDDDDDADVHLQNGIVSPPASQDPGMLSVAQRRELEALQELIRRRLA